MQSSRWNNEEDPRPHAIRSLDCVQDVRIADLDQPEQVNRAVGKRPDTNTDHRLYACEVAYVLTAHRPDGRQ